MFYSSELELFRRVLKNLNIGSHIVSENSQADIRIDGGLRDYLQMGSDYDSLFVVVLERLSNNVIYKLTDSFGCCYIFMVLPCENEKNIFAAGPYLNSDITSQTINEIAGKKLCSQRVLSQLVKYFGNLAVIKDERYLMSFCSAVAEALWGGPENFSVELISEEDDGRLPDEQTEVFLPKADDSVLFLRILEERYAAENRMIKAVSQGNIHVVEQIFANVSALNFEKRTDDPVRNMKNYLIISNTLFRKAAEQGSVHPFYIDALSTEYAKKIEEVRSVADAGTLLQDMVRKYCSLVRNHSLKKYSPLIQQIMTFIDADITADLGLRRFAKMLNVNPSYLSALFKKETEKNLTEYVSQKRTEHAAYLLRTTNLQIQTVAQQCGIYDVNYFAKMFKKIMGKTPKEYRKMCDEAKNK